MDSTQNVLAVLKTFWSSLYVLQNSLAVCEQQKEGNLDELYQNVSNSFQTPLMGLLKHATHVLIEQATFRYILFLLNSFFNFNRMLFLIRYFFYSKRYMQTTLCNLKITNRANMNQKLFFFTIQ